MSAASGRRVGAVLVAVALVAIIVATLLTVGERTPAARQAPALPREVLVGPPLNLADLRGRPALINFWASWCDPCRREAPELRAFASAHWRGALIGIDWSDDLSSARAFIRRFRLAYPNYRDATGATGSAYGISGLPTTFVLDRHGRITAVLRGPQTRMRLDRAFDQS
jgi:cytochrome c biogenesis protein CcmG, thiol:disulfide interchange protein DsbE